MGYREFSEIFIPLGGQLYRVAYFILESESDAQDAVQEMFVRLWEQRESLETVVNPKAYCITLVRNICIDMIRRSGTCRSTSGIPDTIPAGTDTAERMEQRERMARVMDAIDRLPDRQRQVLRMRVFQELSYKEIEEKTGIGYLTLRVLLSQARKQLKKVQ